MTLFDTFQLGKAEKKLYFFLECPIDHPNNNAVPFFPSDVRVVMDTLIQIPNLGGSNCLFSGKYSEHVAKLLGVGLLTGFSLFCPPHLYGVKSGGSSVYAAQRRAGGNALT